MLQHIGLTGGIGSGKSTIGAMFRELGGTVIDADAISRSLTAQDGLAISAIAQEFGPQAIDDSRALNRSFMRQLVFQDAWARERLERIMHPLIQQQIQKQADIAHRDGATTIILDIPLLIESAHWRQQLDAIIVVDCEEETQIQRVMNRSNLDRNTIQKIIGTQASRAQRQAAADWVIYNEGLNFAQLRRKVLSIATQLQL